MEYSLDIVTLALHKHFSDLVEQLVALALREFHPVREVHTNFTNTKGPFQAG